MRTDWLKHLDALLAPMACFAASLAPKFRRAPSGSTLIIRPGGLGDLVCADMALQAIGVNPLTVNWLIETRSQPWAEYRQLHYACFDRPALRTLFAAFASHDRVINSEQLFGLSQAYALWARARDGRIISFDTNRGARHSDQVVSYDWKDAHEVAEFSRLIYFALNPSEGAAGANYCRPRLQPVGGPPLVLVAGRNQRSRRLSLEEWAGVIASWHAGRNFLIASAPDDAVFADELAKKLGAPASRFSGDFAALCGQIARAEDFLTVDGGGVHIASHFGVPTLAIFTSGRDEKWKPIAPGSRVLRRHDLPCQPCTKFGQVPPCPNHFACRQMSAGRIEPA